MKIKVVQYCVTQGQIPEQHRNAAAWQDWTAGLGSKQRISVPIPDAPCWAHRVQEQSPTLLHSSLIPASTPVFIPSISQGHQPTGGIYLIELCVSKGQWAPSTSSESPTMRATGWQSSISDLSTVWICEVFLTTKDANTLSNVSVVQDRLYCYRTV